jgi:sugar phosphate isomerase/epimerase
MVVSIISNFLGPEDKGLAALASLGYTRVEAPPKGEASLAPSILAGIAQDCGIEIHSVMDWHRGIADADAEMRKQAMRRLAENIEWAHTLGAKVLETVPMWHGSPDERGDAWKRAVEAYSQSAATAKAAGIVLAIEPVRRQESDLVNTLSEGVQMAREVGHPHVRMMGDTHHMHYEDTDPAAAAREAAGWVIHMHFSDNDRLPPGQGVMDLAGIVRALSEIGYEGSLSLSEMAKAPDAETAAREGLRATRGLIEEAMRS